MLIRDGERNSMIGEILVKWGVITKEDLHRALEIQKKKKMRLGDILIKEGIILNERKIAEVLSQEFHLPFVDLSKEKIDKDLLNLFSFQQLKRYLVFPIRKDEGYLLVATTDPLDIQPLQELSLRSGYSVKTVIATKEQIEAYLNKFSAPMQEAAAAIKEITAQKKTEESEIDQVQLKEIEAATQEAPVIKLVNSIIAEAIKQNASDIHFEPQADGLLIRFRMDGVLYERMTIPLNLRSPVISRIKIISGMDITERRKPQDGRMSISLEKEQEFDVRVSTLPGIFGEKVVLRLLNKKSILISLINLGLDEDEQKLVRHLVSQPYGIILVTGPTGSGKTTTLYSILNELNDTTRSIVTVEDPVEYELPRINQTAINVRAGYTFATAIRHILRQDPDIIMVGEIRDLETAEIAIQAALTGHLVLSTLHTNNAPGAIIRLLDMNVEPFLISSAVIGVIAQRLVRKLCLFCKQEYTADKELGREILDLIPLREEQAILARPSGCEKCIDIGYSGRTGIFEILTMDEQIKELILKRADESEITKSAISTGMKTLKVSGIKKAIEKVTSLEEVMRVTFTSNI